MSFAKRLLLNNQAQLQEILAMATKSDESIVLTYPYVKKMSAIPEFPSARYFQIHFEHLENQLEQHRQCLVQIQQQIGELYAFLSAYAPKATQALDKP